MLATMKAEFIAAAERLAAEEGCTVEIDQIWGIEPIAFDQGLIEIAAHRRPRGHGHRPRGCRPARSTTRRRWRARACRR